MRRMFVLVVLASISLALVGPRPPEARAATHVYVAPTGSDSTGAGTLGSPYRTIQFAIDRVGEGGMVSVAPGVYVDDPVGVGRRVTLLGAQAGVDPKGVLTRGAETVLTGTYPLELARDGVVLDGFKVGDGTAGAGRSVVAFGEGVVVQNNIVVGVRDFAIRAVGRATITKNTVAHSKDGIRSDHLGTGVTDRVEIIGNTVFFTEYAGINVVAPWAYIAGNTLHDCNYLGSDDVGDWDYASIHLDRQSAHTVVQGNTISDGANGVQVWGDYVSVLDNDISAMGKSHKGDGDGMKLVNDDRLYRNAAIIVGTNFGVVSSEQTPVGVVVRHNRIHGNAFGLFYSDDLAGSVDARENWWGSSAGPRTEIADVWLPRDGGDRVSRHVQTGPWYTDEAMTDLAGSFSLLTLVTGSGEVHPDPAGPAYPAGTAVTLAAEPEPGWHFVGWSDDGWGAANPLDLRMGHDLAVSATFARDDSPTYPDVPVDYPYRRAIAGLASEGIISGYDDGTFRPDNPVLRAQFAKMICGALDLAVVEGAVPLPFADVEQPANDLYPDDYVAVAAANQITQGVGGGRFAPYADITRAQVISMLVRGADRLRPGVLRTPPGGYNSTLGNFSPDHGASFRVAEYNGLLGGLRGFGPGWDPWAKASRGEVAQMLYAWWELAGGGGHGTSTASQYPHWRGEYYRGVALADEPILVRDDPTIDFPWGMGGPSPVVGSDDFSARWTRTLWVAAGRYSLRVLADDGVRVWVDGSLVLESWIDTGRLGRLAFVDLAGGPHDVRVEYYERSGGAWMRLWINPVTPGG